MSLVVARHQWEEGQRRIDAARSDRKLALRMDADLELLVKELRRRVGGNFTLDQLADVYDHADAWARALLEERGSPGWPAHLSIVLDAAFHLYARGAIDYAP